MMALLMLGASTLMASNDLTTDSSAASMVSRSPVQQQLGHTIDLLTNEKFTSLAEGLRRNRNITTFYQVVADLQVQFLDAAFRKDNDSCARYERVLNAMGNTSKLMLPSAHYERFCKAVGEGYDTHNRLQTGLQQMNQAVNNEIALQESLVRDRKEVMLLLQQNGLHQDANILRSIINSPVDSNFIDHVTVMAIGTAAKHRDSPTEGYSKVIQSLLELVPLESRSVIQSSIGATLLNTQK